MPQLWILQGPINHRSRVMNCRDVPSRECVGCQKNEVALIFPGQGSQFPGMSSDLTDGTDITRNILGRADECLGYHLSRIMGGEPPGELDRTCYTQPAIFVHSVAIYEELRSRCEMRPFISAGHSLGEYSALYAAGILGFEDALGIIRERAMAMDGAQPHGTCGMAAVLGLTRERCEDLIRDARGPEVLCLANQNAPDQIVVSGHLPAIHRVMEAINKEKRARAVLLNVSSAFHTPLMEPALTRLSMIVDASPINEAAFPVVANVDAKPYPSQSEAIRQRLVSQVVSPVLWEDSVRYMMSQGVTTFVELGPGKVLTGLVRRIDKTAKTTNLFSVSACRLFAEEWQ